MTPNSIYLKSLTLRNFATFEDGQIYFHQHFNTIIGETGSGKSLILDALQLILGQRAEKRYIRKNADFAIIEACFSISGAEELQFFSQLGFPCENSEIVIKRIINKGGTSKAYLNFQQCPLGHLQLFSKKFVDLVGQFENQKLLDSSYQLQLIDIFAQNEEQTKEYQDIYQQLQNLKSQLQELEAAKINNIQRRDFLEFQVNEFDSLATTTSEEDRLIQEKERLINFEKNQILLNEIQQIVDGEQNSLQSRFKTLLQRLEHFSDFSEHLPVLEQVRETLTDISYATSNLLDQEVDEQKLSETVDRLDHIQKIKRKYNLDLEGISTLIDSYRQELGSISNIDDEIEQAKQALNSLIQKATQLAEALHTRRNKAAQSVSNLVTQNINHLNMSGASLEFKVTKNKQLSPMGITELNVYAETNPGEGQYPLKQIASGGELSRILLAFRQVLANKDSISIFLFDEIDTGIGGETAMKIGKTLQDVALNSQVIAITHLPQIANFAHQLIDIQKESAIQGETKRTFSKISIIGETDKKSDYIKRMVPIS